MFGPGLGIPDRRNKGLPVALGQSDTFMFLYGASGLAEQYLSHILALAEPRKSGRTINLLAHRFRGAEMDTSNLRLPLFHRLVPHFVNH